MDDSVHDRVRVHAAAEPRVPVLLPELRAQDGRRPPVAQLEKLQQHPPEQLVRPLEQPLVDHEQAERPVLTQQLPLAAGPVAALAPEVLEVGLPYVAGPDPLGAGRLGERAREVGLAVPGRPEEYDVVAALGESAGREFCHRDPVEPAPLGEVFRPHVRLRVPERRPLGEAPHLLADEGRVGLVHGRLEPLGARHEQVDLGHLAGHGVHERHRGPRPVDLHVPTGLVPHAADDVAPDGELAVALAEAVVGHRGLARARGRLGVLGVQELERHARPRELPVHAVPVGTG